jgi:hypothetical protein
MANTMTDGKSLDDKVNKPYNEQDEYDPRNPNRDGILTRFYDAGKELWEDTKGFASSIQASADGEYRPSRAGLTSAIGAAVVGGALVSLPACDGGPGVEPKPPQDTTDTTNQVDSVEASAELELFSQRGAKGAYIPVNFSAGEYSKTDTTNKEGIVSFSYTAPENLSTVRFTGGSGADSNDVKPFTHEYTFSDNLSETAMVDEYILGQGIARVFFHAGSNDDVISDWEMRDNVTGEVIESGTSSRATGVYVDYSITDSLRIIGSPAEGELDFEAHIDTTISEDTLTPEGDFDGEILDYTN